MEEKEVLELLFEDNVEFTANRELRPVGPEVSILRLVSRIMLQYAKCTAPFG